MIWDKIYLIAMPIIILISLLAGISDQRANHKAVEASLSGASLRQIVIHDIRMLLLYGAFEAVTALNTFGWVDGVYRKPDGPQWLVWLALGLLAGYPVFWILSSAFDIFKTRKMEERLPIGCYVVLPVVDLLALPFSFPTALARMLTGKQFRNGTLSLIATLAVLLPGIANCILYLFN